MASNDASHLLVVDDDEALRELLQRYLGEHGYRVSCVPEGEAMKAFLREHAVDLVAHGQHFAGHRLDDPAVQTAPHGLPVVLVEVLAAHLGGGLACLEAVLVGRDQGLKDRRQHAEPAQVGRQVGDAHFDGA